MNTNGTLQALILIVGVVLFGLAAPTLYTFMLSATELGKCVVMLGLPAYGYTVLLLADAVDGPARPPAPEKERVLRVVIVREREEPSDSDDII